MRVLVIADVLGQLVGMQAGQLIGEAFAGTGAQVAVVPVAEKILVPSPSATESVKKTTNQCLLSLSPPNQNASGNKDFWVVDDFCAPLAKLWQTSVDFFAGCPVVISGRVACLDGRCIELVNSSYPLGQKIAQLLRCYPSQLDRIYVGLPAPLSPEGGIGLITALARQTAGGNTNDATGQNSLDSVDLDQIISPTDFDPTLVNQATKTVDGVELIGVVTQTDSTYKLGGLSGLIGSWAFETKQEISVRTRMDADFSVLAEKLSSATGLTQLPFRPGSGSAMGLGIGFLALGGRVLSYLEVIGEVADLPMSISQSDLIVIASDRFALDHGGGDLVEYLRFLGASNTKPVIGITTVGRVPLKDARGIGLEEIYYLTRENFCLSGVEKIARSWTW